MKMLFYNIYNFIVRNMTYKHWCIDIKYLISKL